MSKVLKNYQEKAVSQLIITSKMYFDTNKNETIIFQSPTGSGKTFMITNYMSDIVKEIDLDVCFLWVSIGEGDLHNQSKKSVSRDISSDIQCSLLEDEFFGTRRKINKNEIVFVNWEKIRNKDRKTGEYTNKLMKDKDEVNFIEVLQNTRDCGINIVLIIDECHSNANTERAIEIRDEIIRPVLTIEMSATPVLNDYSTKVVVEPNDVIEEQMIKKEIIINDGIEKIADDEITSERLILESAYIKRKELKKHYEKVKSVVNPLVLIQLPNARNGEVKKESVLKFLKEKGVDDSKIAIWLSDQKINQDYETLNSVDSKIEYLIFKQAIDTGWDCPRAQILIKLRETNSIVFEIQTVGRILRMPEAKHYEIEELNKAYVYTNIKSIEIKKEVYNPNIIKSLYSNRREIYKELKLSSYYRNRVDYGVITSSYRIFFEKTFCNFLGLDLIEDEDVDFTKNIEKLNSKCNINDDNKLDSIINNAKIDSKKIDQGMKLNNLDVINIMLSDADLENAFNNLIISNLSGFAPKRSISRVKTAILFCFRKYFNIKPADRGIIKSQNIIVTNSEIFGEIILSSIEDYKKFHKDEVDKKSPGRVNNEWEIPISKNYNPKTNKKIQSRLSLYEPLYMPVDKNGEVDELEIDFINHIQNYENMIEWFWKNGDEHMESNFGIKKEDGYTFQPDFIIKFKDGRIGIFDTKAGKGFNETDNFEKSNALYKYIAESRYEGKNIVGGLVIQDNGIFKYFSKPVYKSYKESQEGWERFDNLFNK